jgi:glycosyltransferase involved in cell wall biosynthesis
MVSVIIPCYNLGRYLAEAIASVRQQEGRPFEIVVVDDGSTDPQTLNILDGCAGEGITVLHTANQGLAASRNEGISHANGVYILPLDADDRLAPGFLAKAAEELDRNPDTGIVYGLVELFGDAGGLWELPDFTPDRLLYDNMIVATAMFRRKEWLSVGGYCHRMLYGWEDWDFWLSLVERGCRVVRMPQVALFYRIRKDSMTRGMTCLQKLVMFWQLLIRHWRLYGRHWPAFFRKLADPRPLAPRLPRAAR